MDNNYWIGTDLGYLFYSWGNDRKLEFKDSASYYYKQIVNAFYNSKFRPNALSELAILDKLSFNRSQPPTKS